MKKFYIFALVAAMFAACSTDVTEDVAIEAPETLKVSFEESSRIQLDDNKTVWTKGDLVSVFYRSDANQQWKFQGNTGDRSGTIKRVSTPEYSHTTSKMVVAYPYDENYYLNPETCNLQAFLPAEQTYLKDSYGINGNIMVSQSEYKQFVLKSVCGWLRIRLIGNGEKVQSIKLKGNNGEQVAGEIYINTADATSILAAEMGFSSDHTQVGGTMVEDDTILTEVTLGCGDGVTLGSESSAFYIALPPQEFSKGLTVEIEDTEGYVMEQSTDKVVTIERNTIQPMAVFEYIETQLNNKIWYTSSDGNVVTPNESNVFGANIVSNTYKNGKGVIKFDGNVTSIGLNAFFHCTSLTSVTIPNSVTSIGWYAFCGCTSLTSVTIPDSVTEIGSHAFNRCTSLTSVNIPDSVTVIGDNAFCSCTSLTSVTIPDSVTEIGEDAFCDCTSLTAFDGKFASADNRCLIIDGVLNSFAPKGLTEYTIPDSVTSIRESAFYNCTSLTSVTIPDSVTSIGSSAFSSCDSLTSITIPNSVISIGGSAFSYCSSLTSITIPDSVTSIGDSAFRDCTSLTSVTIPNSVTEIGYYAFYNCTSLTNVTIPDRVTSIGEYAFYWCTSLTSVTIPDSVTSIGDFAFCNCDSLTSVTIGDSVTSIGDFAFCNCDSLTSVTIPDSVTSIGSNAFSYCDSLTNITIPDSVTEIGSYAFENCDSLTSVTIPDGVTSIGSYAFRDCSSLKEVYCKPTTPPSGDSDMFGYNAAGRKIYVPRASVDAYKAASGWSDYKSYIVPYDFE